MVGLISSSIIMAIISTALAEYFIPVALSMTYKVISQVYIGSSAGAVEDEAAEDDCADEAADEIADEDDGSDEVPDGTDGLVEVSADEVDPEGVDDVLPDEVTADDVDGTEEMFDEIGELFELDGLLGKDGRTISEASGALS